MSRLDVLSSWRHEDIAEPYTPTRADPLAMRVFQDWPSMRDDERSVWLELAEAIRSEQQPNQLKGES